MTPSCDSKNSGAGCPADTSPQPSHAKTGSKYGISTASVWKRFLFALGLTLLLTGGLVLATLFCLDDASAMRAATDLAMPLGLVWSATFFFAMLALLSGKRALGCGLLAGWLAIELLGNDYVARHVMAPIEWQRDPSALADPTPFRTVVSLGGSLTINPDNTIELSMDGQRVMLAAQLWHAGKTQSVLCTGSASDGTVDPSDACREMLESVGVPSDKIFEIKGRNTTEEMQSLKEFLADPPADFPASGRVGLITSAFHMQRTMRLATDRGLELVPLPCSFRVGRQGKFSPRVFIPDAATASTLATACKERLARVLGR